MSIPCMLEFEEGREHLAYADPLTKSDPWTIGVGHTGPEVHAGLVWTDAQIDAALDADIQTAAQHCRNNFLWFDALDAARQAVLVGMMFQMGPLRVLKFINTLAAVRTGRYADAASGIRGSLWGHQTPMRAVRMAEQMETGVWNPHYLET